jgi:hypothetical protein
MNTARQMWTLFEPLHGASYFTAAGRDHFEAIGLRGFWRGYFASRSAPLGPIGAAPIVAAFFSFAPAMVSRALPDVWTRATPAQALVARVAGGVASIEPYLGDLTARQLTEAADLLAGVASEADTAGRVLGAANAALPMPDEALPRLWQAATVLREHRGDGHVAALVAHGLDGCEALVWRDSIDLDRSVLQPARGWTDDQWAAAAQRLTERGWLEGGAATPPARDAHRAIEDLTDDIASRPWRSAGAPVAARLTELLKPLVLRVRTAIPVVNPIGLPPPQ